MTDGKKELRYDIMQAEYLTEEQLIESVIELDQKYTTKLTKAFNERNMSKDMHYDYHSIEGCAQVKKALLYMQYFGIPPEHLPHVLREIGLRRSRG